MLTRPNAAAAVIDHILLGQVQLVTTPAIEAEYLACAFKRPVGKLMQRTGETVQSYLNALATLRVHAEVVHPTGEAPPCRDEKDRMYLHCAVFARVDYLVTADHDLLDLGVIDGIPIVTPAAFLAIVATPANQTS